MKNFFKNYRLFFLLATLSFLIHFAYLGYPAQVVFDEVHFGKFVSAYFTSKFYFDIHPPLGKLLIAAWVKLSGVNPVFSFEKIGELIPAQTLASLRFLPSLTGALFVLAFSWLAYLISRSKNTALIAGFLILLDNAILVQSKFILVDIFLLFFEILTFCFFFLWQKQKSFSWRWWFFLFLTALFFGLTISVKWTGVATLGVITLVLITKIFWEKLEDYLNWQNHPSVISSSKNSLQKISCLNQKPTKKTKIKETAIGLLAIIFIGLLVYLITFAIHFKLVSHSGPGDAFVSWGWQQKLKFGLKENAPNFWQKIIELNKTMYLSSASITSEHPYGSRWWGWPLGYKPVYYWNDDFPGFVAKIYLLSNPFLWWLGSGFIFFTILFILFNKKFRKNISPIFYILILAWIANWLPFILIKRVAFLYHYLLAATFSTLISALYLSRLWPKEKKILFLILGIIGFSFFILLPFCYGWPLPTNIAKYLNYLVILPFEF